MTKSASIKFDASPETVEHTGIVSYEIREDGHAVAFDALGDKVLEIKTTHGEQENTFYLAGSGGVVSTMVRVATRVGVQRVAREVSPPTLDLIAKEIEEARRSDEEQADHQDYVDLRYRIEIKPSVVDVRGVANGSPLHLQVRREYPVILAAEGLPKLKSPMEKYARSMLNDIERYASALARGAITDADGRTIVFSTGHFATCALAAVETGISITFGHPLGLVFGGLGMVACAIWG